MHLAHLHLRDFRNFREQGFSLAKHFNVFVGKNAQGKTNVVEAIALLCDGKSFRTSEFRDLIRWNAAAAVVETTVLHELGEDRWRATLTAERKFIQKNGKNVLPHRQRGLACVIFAPEEILLLRDGPAARRKYMDQIISRFVPGYSTTVRNFDRVIAQRNRVLGDECLSSTERERQLASWDDQLMALGVAILQHRQAWSHQLNILLPAQYAAISKRDGAASFAYRCFFGDVGENRSADELMHLFSKKLIERRSDELIRRISLVGPHRDDFEALVGGVSVRHFGSQGQHRSFVLAMKIAEIELHRLHDGRSPLLLLDDVASELDDERTQFFFQYLENLPGQVFITATDAASVPAVAANARQFVVSAGSASFTFVG